MTRKEKTAAFILSPAYSPMTREGLSEKMSVPEKSLKRFFGEVSELIEDGVVIEGKKGLLFCAQSLGLVKGVLRTNPKGFGFVTPESGLGEDLYVNARNYAGAINGDTVLVSKGAKKNGRDAWCVRRVLKRGNSIVVGTIRLYSGIGIVVPDNEKLPREIYISGKLNAADGQKVSVKITEYSLDGTLRGVIDEVLGYPDDFGVDVLSVIKSYGFNIPFPKKAAEEAKKAPDEISPADLEGRLDLRGMKIITIDGDDSKDLDDAISLEKTAQGYRLGVHIADVSSYVRPKSNLDKEAFSRGCSVYLVDRVIPMLPSRLSNGICSLNEGCDRLTMSVFMDMDEDGTVKKSEFHKSVINSSHRMTYNNVQRLLTEHDEALEKRYADILPMLKEMYALSLKLKRAAQSRGYIELEIPEAKAVLDENGRAVGIELRQTNAATELIEQFMVCANSQVANYLSLNGCPGVYRTHDLPDEGKLKMLRRFVSGMGINPNLSLGEIVEAARGTKQERIVSAMVLRSMAKAKYSPSNSGHYGLGAQYYCHFTSPIRRYPDLMCHRALKAAIDGDTAAMRYLSKTAGEAALQSSERETAAEHCERDTLDMKKAEYMERFVGEDFCAIISSVANFGFFVSLPNTVEGLVSVTSLCDDYYVFDEDALLLRGERLHREYRIGDEVEVTLVSSNKHNRKIEFVVKGLAEAKKPAGKGSGVKGSKEEKKNGKKQGRKNSGAKQKRIPRVFHRRKSRGRH